MFILVLFKFYRYAIVRDMTAAGAGLNKFCYAGLIAAHMNKTPRTDDTAAKVIYKISICFEYEFILLLKAFLMASLC